MEQKLRIELWRHALPVVWIGLVVAISFIEAPLKFQAPGITIPLGLGIGRLVFTALNIVEAVLLIALVVVTFWPKAARVTRARAWWLVGLAVVFIVQIAVIRPPLNARTDLVLSGADPGQSPWHYFYIATDVIVLALLFVLALQAGAGVRRIAREAVAAK